MKKSDNLEFALSKRMVIALLIFYALILVVGCIIAANVGISITREIEKPLLLRKTFCVSLAFSTMLCAVQYTKRLYKACITDRINTSSDVFVQIGNVAYFISRPFFACAFSIFCVYVLLSGMYIVTGSLDYILNEKFLYLCVVISAIIGFSVGKVMDKFESICSEKIDSFK